MSEEPEELEKPERPVVVFDHDGTATDPTPEDIAVAEVAYVTGFAREFELDTASARSHLTQAGIMIRREPHRYGWVIDDRIVAPPEVDIFVGCQVRAQVALQWLRPQAEPGSFDAVLQKIFGEAYKVYRPRLRSELLEVFNALRDAGIPVYIVTNSSTSAVCEQLEALGPEGAWIKDCVRGGAKKYIVTPDGPNWMPQHGAFPGLSRTVYLRRGIYLKTLRELMDAHGANWGNLLVVGDIVELDHRAPMEMGAWGIHILGERTPEWERAWMEAQPRGRTALELREVPRFLGL